MMKIDESKLARQKLIVRNFYSSNESGIAVCPTGFGKTYVGYLIAKELIEKRDSYKTDIKVIAPNQVILGQWKKLAADYEQFITYYTVKYLQDNPAIVLTGDLVIFDEIHEFYTDERIDYVIGKKCNASRKLGLTATVYDRHNRHNRVLEEMPIFDSVSEKEAVENNWIANFIQFNIGVDFADESRQEDYDILSDEITKLLAKFGHSYELAKKCVGGGKDKNGRDYPAIKWATVWAHKRGWNNSLDERIPEHAEILKQWTPNLVIGYARRLMELIRKRKGMLYNAPEKIKPIIRLFEKFDDFKIACFGQSTLFASKLAESINNHFKQDVCTIYHSNIESRPLVDPKTGDFYRYTTGMKKGQPKIFGSSSLKKMAIQAIRSGMVRGISTASALDKGFDVEDIRMAIIHSSTQNFNQQKQRTGRAKRVDYFAKNAVVIIVNVYIKGTKDEDWAKSAQRRNEFPTYNVYDVEEIGTEYKPPTTIEGFNTNM